MAGSPSKGSNPPKLRIANGQQQDTGEGTEIDFALLSASELEAGEQVYNSCQVANISINAIIRVECITHVCDVDGKACAIVRVQIGSGEAPQSSRASVALRSCRQHA